MLIATIDQERWGTAIALLSLDRVEPFYNYMDIHLSDSTIFKELLRTCILENRKDFQLDSTVIPNLKLRTLAKIESIYGTKTVLWFKTWLYESFFFETDDFNEYYTWDDLFSLSRNNDSRWN